MLFIVGILWFVASQLLTKYLIVSEMIGIVTWVFVWAAVEKFFFDRTALQLPRVILLSLVSADIISKEETNK